MKILFLSALYPPNTRGGGEVSTALIADALQDAGHTVDVVTAESSGLPLTAKPLFEQSWARHQARQLLKQVQLKAYDVVHAHDLRTTQILSEWIQAGEVEEKKCYATVRDYAQICGSPNNLLANGSKCNNCRDFQKLFKNQAIVEAPSWRKPFRAWQYWFNFPYRLSSFKRIPNHIYISQAQLKDIKNVQDLADVRTKVIYNPVAPQYISAPVKRPSPHQEILFVGTLQKYKGVNLLLEAFAKISETNKEVHLKIIGDGAGRAELERWVAQRSLQYRVNFAGRVPYDRVMHNYDNASFLVAPHIWSEPFGRTVVEAMARGRLVLAADTGGPAEVIQDSKTGVLFKAGSADDLADKMSDVLNMNHFDRQQIEKTARAWVTERLSPARIAEQYLDAYKPL